MEPYDQVHWCFYTVVNAYFTILRIDIPKSEFRYNFGYFVFLGMNLLAFYGLIYAILNYDIGTASNAVTLCFQGIQIISQSLSVNAMTALTEIVKLIMAIYKDNAQDKIKRPLLIRYAFASELVMKCVLSVYGILTIVYIFYPAGYYLYTGIRNTPFPMYYPWWDEHEDKYYYILSAFHEWEIFYSGVNLSAFFSLITLIFVNVLLLADIFGSRVLKFNENLDDLSSNTKAKLIFLVKEHRNYVKYV